jgi:hypothetical protein
MMQGGKFRWMKIMTFVSDKTNIYTALFCRERILPPVFWEVCPPLVFYYTQCIVQSIQYTLYNTF